MIQLLGLTNMEIRVNYKYWVEIITCTLRYLSLKPKLRGKYLWLTTINLISLKSFSHNKDENDKNDPIKETHINEAILLRLFPMSQHCYKKKKKSLPKTIKSNIDKLVLRTVHTKEYTVLNNREKPKTKVGASKEKRGRDIPSDASTSMEGTLGGMSIRRNLQIA